MATIETENSHGLTRRYFIKGACFFFAGNALDLLFPQAVFGKEPKPKFIPLWVEEKFPHLELKKNGPFIEITGRSFYLDPNILLALLIMESSINIRRSYAGAEGAYQIMPKTKEDLIKEIGASERLCTKRDTLGIKTADLKNHRIFKGQVFLACVYLEKAGVPKGPIITFSEDYPQKLEGIRKAAVKYHDGLYGDVAKPTDYGRLAGKRVAAIFELLQGSKSFKEIPKDVADFLGIDF